MDDTQIGYIVLKGTNIRMKVGHEEILCRQENAPDVIKIISIVSDAHGVSPDAYAWISKKEYYDTFWGKTELVCNE